ncbi:MULTISPECIES: ClpXP protease specificity-enhancing factor [Neptunomonas]|uniref:ClpXP protease specificity-enhancing factor n=1 Tax=Neptunomonas marina TaxID=1815562 RepID=A0A437Q7I9_9GAMM|nr:MULTISPECIES: ClpXP protease specificity-enhancing factor [Neptunomonas]RVU30467.1 ClpXP protease specificity-enhancing factor [Neptunomonas marina]
MNPSRPYLLRALHQWVVDANETPHIAVDAMVSGVMVPEQFISDGQIILNISPSAVQSLMIDDDAISFSARFGGVPMNVYVPMAAVLAIYARESGAGMGFGMEPGADLYELQPEPTPPEPTPPQSSRPALKVVK